MLNDGDNYVHWAWLVRDLKETAISEWREEHAPGVPQADLFAYQLRRIRVIVDEFPGGAFDIYVRIQARRASQGEWYFTKVRRISGIYYIL